MTVRQYSCNLILCHGEVAGVLSLLCFLVQLKSKASVLGASATTVSFVSLELLTCADQLRGM